jgi:flavin-dependent dehydrogenase
MPETYDVVVVGARCAGAPLATLLARAGARVAVVEQATLPSDTLSSHVFEADGLAVLDRLGVVERLESAGVPMVNRVDVRLDDVQAVMPWPRRPGDVGGVASCRRPVLDTILADAAQHAGVELFMSSKAFALTEDDGRVSGVRATGELGELDLRARLVVGADGRNSTVGQLAGARRYNATPNQRLLYWAYFEGARIGEPTFVSHRWSDRFILGIPTDGGLYQVLVWPEIGERDRLKADLEGTFMDHASSCPPVAEAISGARRIDKIRGAVKWEGFFREASGPGWVLAGDAGHFKDPAPGRGISDALAQAEALAPVIVKGLATSDRALDEALREWGRWRDREFEEEYWLASDLGAAGELPAVLPEVFRALHAKGEAGALFDVINHRLRPSELLTQRRVLAATVRALGRRRHIGVLGEVALLGATDLRRRRLNRHPRYVEEAA